MFGLETSLLMLSNWLLGKLKIINSILVIGFCYTISIFAQPKVQFSHAGIEKGLSQSSVNCMVQDNKGFIWIGTQDGLNRYDGYSIKTFRNNPSDKQSLSDNFIQSLLVDRLGNIWVGTWGGGLNKYNPITNKFIVYKHDINDTNSLCSNIVMSLYEDDSGLIWIGTSGNGLDCFDNKTNTFKHIAPQIPFKTVKKNNRFRCFYGDRKGNLWIGTSEQGLIKYNHNKHSFEIFSKETHANIGFKDNAIQSIIVDKNNNLWIGTSNAGLLHFNAEKNIFTNYNTTELITSNNQYAEITSLIIDTNQCIWFGTFGKGLGYLDVRTNKITVYKHNPVEPNSLSNDVVLSLLFDKQQLLFVGTIGKGISYFSPHKENFEHIKNNPNATNTLSHNMIMAVFVDSTETLWIGTYGGGLNQYNPKTNKFTVYKHNTNDKYSIPSNIVRCMFVDSKKRFWIGTYNGGLSWMNTKNGKFTTFSNQPDNEKSLSHNDVWCIFEDNDGNIWAGTWNGLNKLDERTRQFTQYKFDKYTTLLESNRIMSVSKRIGNKIWIGTNGGGLILFNLSTGIIEKHFKNESDNNSLPNNRIRSLYLDNNDILWIGTDGGGLCKLYINDDKIEIFNEATGLPNGVIYAILPFRERYLWLSTNKGICRFDKISYDVWSFDILDGLQSNEFNQGAAWKTENNKFYFGGVNGLNAFNAEKIQKNMFIPEVVITNIKLFGKPITLDSAASYKRQLSFSYSQNFISFEFTALNLIVSDKNQFACFMEGFDRNWIELGNQRQITYTNLDPGEYIFRIKASNNDGIWNNEGTAIKIIIHPPFWKTKTFYISTTLVLILLVILIVQLRLRNLKKAKIMLEIEVRDRTSLIVNQNKEIFEKNQKLEEQAEEMMLQKKQLEKLNHSLEKQKLEIELKNKSITDSIRYSFKIQQSILPDKQYFKTVFPESFVIYFPKDIVSGDFFWLKIPDNANPEEIFRSKNPDDYILWASIDCTGHGVPGAFMSLMAYQFLNNAFKEVHSTSPSEMLNFVNEQIINIINKNQEEYAVRDGMDIMLCKYYPAQKILQYAGAGMSMYLIRNKELSVFKGDLRPIGYPLTTDFPSYSLYEIIIQNDDFLCTFSDGFIDQFDENLTHKYSTKRFKELLLKIHTLPISAQKYSIIDEYNAWKGKTEQLDDILIIGIKF